MADSSVAVTAGTGTNIDTRTEGTNGNHRQVVVLGDPSINAGVAPVDGTAGLKVNLGADNDVTVSGTVTANLSATDNAVLDSIDADTTTIIGHVDGIEGLLTTIDTDTSSMNTDLGTIAGAVSGTEMQVDVVAALPAGTNAIGKLAANSGVDIGDTTVNNTDASPVIAKPAFYDYSNDANTWREYYTATTPTDGIIHSPAAGKRWHCTFLYISVSAASTVTIEDDLVAGDNPVWKGEIAANSGIAIPIGDIPFYSAEDAADLTITASAGTVYVTAIGYDI